MEENKIDLVEYVGNITSEDIDDGTVLIFRISEKSYPPHMLKSVTDSIKNSVHDLFEGKVKAMILPDTIDVKILKELLKEKINEQIRGS